jgi:hypothetical protein
MAKSLFDHLNAVYADQSLDYWNKLDESDRKSYSSYMINRFISMNSDYLPFVNEFQKYYSVINNELSYLFYSQLLPKRRQFNKYIKGSKDAKYEPWAIDLISRYFEVSLKEAEEYIGLLMLTEEGKEEFRQLLTGYGADAKKVNKAVGK